MATAQPHLLPVDPQEMAELEERRLLARQALNLAILRHERTAAQKKAAREAFQAADTALARARYGDAWDATLGAERNGTVDVEDEEDDDLAAALIELRQGDE